eukprot:9744065-Alexandrium_andersonii.AAC.1
MRNLPDAMPPDTLLSDMAGNAFSAFACGPLLMGVVQTTQAIFPETINEGQILGGCEDGESLHSSETPETG